MAEVMAGREAGESILSGAAPAGLAVQGSLSLESGELAGLPDGLSVLGSLSLVGCRSLVSLGKGLRVRGELRAVDCGSLESLPDDVEVGGAIMLERCGGLRLLPDGLRVRGDLVIRNCPSLEALPEGLEVDGTLDASGCGRLRRLPRDLAVLGELRLSRCGSLQALPEGLYVEEAADLEGTRVGAMPADHHVPAYLVQGVAVPARVYWEAHKLTVDEVLALRDVEVRRIALERMGWEVFLARSGAKAQLLDADQDERVGALYRVGLGGEEPIQLLKVRCATLPRSYVLRVPPTCKTALEANAWTWGLPPQEYRPQEQA